MAVQVSYPGVYIEEFAPGAPIQGVGTSTVAFIGPARSGDLSIPTKLASFDTFKALFGAQPLPGFFMWYAVRGFYENGGQICYVVSIPVPWEELAGLLCRCTPVGDQDRQRLLARKGGPADPRATSLRRGPAFPALRGVCQRVPSNENHGIRVTTHVPRTCPNII